jgi:hypothetical protein
MCRRAMRGLLACVFVLSALAACAQRSSPAASLSQPASSGAAGASTAASTGGASAASAVASEDAAGNALAEAIVDDSDDHADAVEDVQGSSESTRIMLNGNSITVEGEGATVDGSTVTITSAGTYSISGSLADGQIIVNSDDEETVGLLLNGVNIHSSTSAPIYVISAAEAVVILGDNTENHLSDGDTHVFANADEDEPNAALFSKADLTIYGNGSLTVAGNYNDAIASKDGLEIAGGTITVSSVDDGIRGKDYLIVKSGNIQVTAQGDGLKSDNEDDATRGYISIEAGVINITCGGDAIQAVTNVWISGGDLTIVSGGGSDSGIAADISAKGIKAGVNLRIDEGTFTINSADDALHSNGSLTINGGTFVISTGDDAIHADATLEVNGGQISITESYEGMESAVITVNDGDIRLVSTDDGINVSIANGDAGMSQGAAMGGRPGRGGAPGQGGGPNAFDYSATSFLYVNGGHIVVNSGGDGVDVNGSIVMTDGVVIVHGPTMQMNGALDCVGSFNVSGGFLVAVGSAGMAEAPDASSTQNSLLLNFSGTLQSGALVHIESSDGQEVLTFAPTKQIQSIAFSSPDLKNGSSYNVYYGGSSTGTVTDGLYQDGTYAPGTQYTSFTVSSTTTRLGSNYR